MEDKFPKLQSVQKDPDFGKDWNPFLHLLQKSLLLALLERGQLNRMEYRIAEEQLNRQRRERIRRLLESGEIP